MKVIMRRLVYLLVTAAVIAAIAFGFVPKPVTVDLAKIERGSLKVTIDEDGRTRIREKYIRSAPLHGRLLRIDLEPGDRVTRSQTLLATIEPAEPALLDKRTKAEAEARVMRAKAALDRADPILQQARIELEHAETELARTKRLRKNDAASQDQLEDSELVFRTKSEAFRYAKIEQEIATHELQLWKAALVHAEPLDDDNTEKDRDDAQKRRAAPFEIKSPIDGVVLKVFQESSSIISPGTPLLELGDPTDLEIEIDVLSSDAVKISPGDPVIIEHWGGTEPLDGRVSLVEPSAFTKISALGVEEQRVWVIVDIVNPAEQRKTLGDGYRIEGRIVIWSEENILRIPTSALFRDHEQHWCVFQLKGQKVEQTRVEIGESNGLYAQVLSGLSENDYVVVHPSDQTKSGVTVVERTVESPN